MADSLSHRGPDDAGYWVHSSLDVNFGFRRLAILDLSAAGSQPMRSTDGRYTVIFNGEIFNYRAIGQELASLGHRFGGHSDTEVALAAFTEWGISDSIRKFAGMFAMAIWDDEARELCLIRDRFGKKPLYYGWQGDKFLFASELKALNPHPDFSGSLDSSVLASYLVLSYIPAPASIFEGIRKLEPGTILRVKAQTRAYERERFWSYSDVMMEGYRHPIDRYAVVSEFHSVFEQSVSERMLADVPVGAFLSGGVDSSLVVATMQSLSREPVKTFTIGFHEDTFDEARYAHAVAEHLGTEHHDMYVTPVEAYSAIQGMSSIYDEPFADSSQLPTYLVAAMARAHVTVALTGDGGDEIFGGYYRYLLAARMNVLFATLPAPLRRLVARAITSISPERWTRITGLLSSSYSGERIHKFASVLSSPNAEEAYRQLLGLQQSANLLNKAVQSSEPVLSSSYGWSDELPPVLNMMVIDATTYLADDILVKVDRATMAVGLEARCPFLDHRLAEWAATVPLEAKLKRGVGKRLLREMLRKHLPAELVGRPKMGFSIPLAEWLRGPLRKWSEGVFDMLETDEGKVLDRAAVWRLWREHLSGSRDWQQPLWNVLVLLQWMDQWRTRNVRTSQCFRSALPLS